MVDVDRMVARLGELVKDAHAASALCSGGKHGVTEVLLVHHLRTGEGKEDAARTYLFEGLGIELGVTAKGIAQGIAVLGKGRRVEDNQVVLVAHAVEELEGIFRKSLVTGIAGEVERYILVGQVDGFGRAVYRVNEVGPSPHGIERETAGVAEHVEHVTALGIAFQQGTVLTLVDEETGLLSLEPVYVELQSVLHGHVLRTSAFKEAVFSSQQVGLEGQRGF